jgi:serine/threonine-protein kinase
MEHHEAGFADTLDASTPAEFAETLDDARQTMATEKSLSPTLVGTMSTVLPNVTLVDGQPKLEDRDGPRYSLQGEIGSGGMGDVLRARDEDIGRDVAVKRLRNGDSMVGVARFIEEMKITGQLDHPNVVPVHDVGMTDAGEYYFIMRHVRGETLEEIIARLRADDPEAHKRFTLERRVHIFMQVLEALAYAHSRGIIHRDLKPANVMVGPFGEVVLMDWGVARPVDAPDDLATNGGAPAVDDAEGAERAFKTQAGALVGTPAYMAPEQVRCQSLDGRTDLYAAAVLLHELLFLRHYLAGHDKLVEIVNAVMTHELPMGLGTPSKLQPNVPADLFWIVHKGLRKDPDKRFQSAEEMLDRLHRRDDGEIQVQCPYTFSKSILQGLVNIFDRFPTTTIIVLVGALIGVVGMFAYLLTR